MALMPALKKQRPGDGSLVYILSSSAIQEDSAMTYIFFRIHMFKIVQHTETKLIKMHKLQLVMLKTLLMDIREIINGDILCACEQKYLISCPFSPGGSGARL